MIYLAFRYGDYRKTKSTGKPIIQTEINSKYGYKQGQTCPSVPLRELNNDASQKEATKEASKYPQRLIFSLFTHIEGIIVCLKERRQPK